MGRALQIMLVGALVFCWATLFADSIELKNGDKISGKIVEEKDDSVTIETAYGKMTIPRERIANIEKDAPPADLKDVIRLKNGDRITGRIVEEGEDSVVIETDFGKMTIPREKIASIGKAGGAEDEYKRKLKELAGMHYDLAKWCREKGLEKEARKELEKVIALDPDHEKARKELGYEKVGGEWKKAKKETTSSGGSGKPFMGVRLAEGESGVLAEEVVPGGPSDKAGLRSGDEILKMDGKETKTREDLIAELQKHKPGDVVTLTIKRGSEEKEIKLTLGERPKSAAAGPGGIDMAKMQRRIQELLGQGKSWDEIRKIIRKEFGVDIRPGGGPGK